MIRSEAPELLSHAAGRDGDPSSDEARGTDKRSLFVSRLVERYRDPLLRHLTGLLSRPEDAEDVLQETCRRLLDAPHLDPRSGRAPAYMFKIATHLAYDRFRARRLESFEADGYEATLASAAHQPDLMPSGIPAEGCRRNGLRSDCGRPRNQQAHRRTRNETCIGRLPEAIEEVSMHTHRSKGANRTAASWFVDVIDQPADPAAEGRFMDWLDSDDKHPDELARCEASIHLARQLASDAELQAPFTEAADLARARDRHRTNAWGPRWSRNPAIAWAVAGASAAVAVLAIISQPEAPPQRMAHATDMPAILSLPITSTDPVVELPGHIIVDAHSVAVLPFTSSGSARTGQAGNERLATSMHEGLVEQLSTIPGLYVIGRESVQPYDGSDLRLEEIAAHLGVRGIVQANITPAGNRVRIVLRLTDAATDELLFQSVYERPLERLNSIDSEMANSIALALARPAQPAPPPSIRKGEIT